MDEIIKTKPREDELFYLFDKYLKESDNFLPLQAYLEYLETEKLDAFYSICSKPNLNNNVSSNLNSNEALTSSTTLKLNTLYNLSSTLSLAKNHHLLDSNLEDAIKSKNEYILSQKLYKIIISIDYSSQRSSLDFIKKSLEQTFEKLSLEFDEFFTACPKNEPQIYVTALLWNSSFFQLRNLSFNPSYMEFQNENYKNMRTSIPFTILCHSKRLLKSNILELSSYIFDKVNESKILFLEPVKFNFESNQDFNPQNLSQQNVFFNFREKTMENIKHSKTHDNTYILNNQSSFDVLLNNIINIFKFFGVNEFIEPTSLGFSHHIYITDGLIYTNDMIGCLEKISKSSITFSFIYSGSRSLLSGSNISSGFGYLANHFFMKFLSNLTNGFY
jgi:hypothetical protein